MAAPTGGPWGSTFVDAACAELMEEVLTPRMWALLSSRTRLELLSAFEDAKATFGQPAGGGAAYDTVRAPANGSLSAYLADFDPWLRRLPSP